MAKRQKLELGKWANFDIAGFVQRIKDAIKNDDQLMLEISTNTFFKLPRVVKEILRKEGITEESLRSLVKNQKNVSGSKRPKQRTI